jgi:hypothetical protein
MRVFTLGNVCNNGETQMITKNMMPPPIIETN